MKYNLQRANIFSPARKALKRAKIIANAVDSIKEKVRNLSDQQLTNKTNEFVNRLNAGETLDDILVEALAVARETVYRVNGMFAYKVQLIGSIIIHWGDFAELYTGEGKTLVCVLAAYVDALSKRGLHIVSVNEYLVQRDAKFCAECLNPLGITVGYNLSSFDSDTKRKMYAMDITYTTNSELGFDYLRDNMVRAYSEKVIRELNFAICDEGDSILIDEARTPLIISGQPKQNISLYVDADRFVKMLNSNDYKRDHEANSIVLTDSGVEKAQSHFRLQNFYNIENSELVHKIKNSLMANFVFQSGVEYVVREDEILLVDQFTGRIMEGRSYNAGLQQAIQAKENVKIEPENITVATITYQSFFRLYSKLSGCSGTAFTESEEFMKIYNMLVVNIPTNKPIARKDQTDYVFSNKVSKWHHVSAEIEKIYNSTKQPILVGTASVDDSEDLAEILKNKGIGFELLNAKNHAKEAEIVKKAGQLGAVTIATNMAGRGTDIKLGKGVVEVGGLYVIGTERHESRRIDNQLRGRSGRQGDPGVTRFFISLEDTLFRRYAIEKKEKSSKEIDAEVYNSSFFNKMLNITQKKVEGLNFDVRKNLIDYDGVLSKQRELMYKQRDQILLVEDNTKTLLAMCKHVSSDIVTNCINEDNGIYVNENKIVNILNIRFFNAIILLPKIFHKKTSSEANEILTKIFQISVNNRLLLLGERAFDVIKNIMLQNFDYHWTNHLDKITKIREGVTLRSLEQRSPLNIYINEADKNFNIMKQNIANSSIVSLHKLFIPNSINSIHELLQKEFKDGVVEKVNIAANNARNLNQVIGNMGNKNIQIITEQKNQDNVEIKNAENFEKTKLNNEKDVVISQENVAEVIEKNTIETTKEEK